MPAEIHSLYEPSTVFPRKWWFFGDVIVVEDRQTKIAEELANEGSLLRFWQSYYRDADRFQVAFNTENKVAVLAQADINNRSEREAFLTLLETSNIIQDFTKQISVSRKSAHGQLLEKKLQTIFDLYPEELFQKHTALAFQFDKDYIAEQEGKSNREKFTAAIEYRSFFREFLDFFLRIKQSILRRYFDKPKVISIPVTVLAQISDQKHPAPISIEPPVAPTNSMTNPPSLSVITEPADSHIVNEQMSNTTILTDMPAPPPIVAVVSATKPVVQVSNVPVKKPEVKKEETQAKLFGFVDSSKVTEYLNEHDTNTWPDEVDTDSDLWDEEELNSSNKQPTPQAFEKAANNVDKNALALLQETLPNRRAVMVGKQTVKTTINDTKSTPMANPITIETSAHSQSQPAGANDVKSSTSSSSTTTLSKLQPAAATDVTSSTSSSSMPALPQSRQAVTHDAKQTTPSTLISSSSSVSEKTITSQPSSVANLRKLYGGERSSSAKIFPADSKLSPVKEFSSAKPVNVAAVESNIPATPVIIPVQEPTYLETSILVRSPAVQPPANLQAPKKIDYTKKYLDPLKTIFPQYAQCNWKGRIFPLTTGRNRVTISLELADEQQCHYFISQCSAILASINSKIVLKPNSEHKIIFENINEKGIQHLVNKSSELSQINVYQPELSQSESSSAVNHSR